MVGAIARPAAVAFGRTTTDVRYQYHSAVVAPIGISISQIVESFGDVYPGTRNGDVGYTVTSTQTASIRAPMTPTLKANQYAYLFAFAKFKRYVYDFRRFNTDGEIVNKWVRHGHAFAWRVIVDEGPITVPVLKWVVVNHLIIGDPLHVRWKLQSPTLDEYMPTRLSYDQHKP